MNANKDVPANRKAEAKTKNTPHVLSSTGKKVMETTPPVQPSKSEKPASTFDDPKHPMDQPPVPAN